MCILGGDWEKNYNLLFTCLTRLYRKFRIGITDNRSKSAQFYGSIAIL